MESPGGTSGSTGSGSTQGSSSSSGGQSLSGGDSKIGEIPGRSSNVSGTAPTPGSSTTIIPSVIDESINSSSSPRASAVRNLVSNNGAPPESSLVADGSTEQLSGKEETPSKVPGNSDPSDSPLSVSFDYRVYIGIGVGSGVIVLGLVFGILLWRLRVSRQRDIGTFEGKEITMF